MKFAIRIAGATAILGTVVGLAWSNSDIWSEVGCDFWNMSRLNEEILQSEARHEKLSAESAVVLQRVVAKDAIAEGLIDGSISLSAAMDKFGVLSAGNQARLQCYMERKYPGISQEEAIFRNILEFVHAQRSFRPEAADVEARLISEWQQLLQQRTIGE
jgi:hypothetical protein